MQIVATVLSGLVQSAMKEGLLQGVPDLCSDTQAARLVCPTARSVYNASIIWYVNATHSLMSIYNDATCRGLVGPRRIFGSGSPYVHILWALLAGALLPLPAWYLARRYKKDWLSLVNFPVMLTGASFIPPGSGINYSSWFLAAFIFRKWSEYPDLPVLPTLCRIPHAAIPLPLVVEILLCHISFFR